MRKTPNFPPVQQLDQQKGVQQQLDSASGDWPSSGTPPGPPWEAPACQCLDEDEKRRHFDHHSTVKATTLSM